MSTKNAPGQYDCYAKAEPDEPMFVLLGRDPVAHIVVALWAELRLRMGTDSAQVNEAMSCASAMAEYAAERKGKAVHAASLVALNDTILHYVGDPAFANVELLRSVVK